MLAPFLKKRFGWVGQTSASGVGLEDRPESIASRNVLRGSQKLESYGNLSMRPLEGAGFRTVYIKEGKVLAMAPGEEVDQETQQRESYWRMKSSQRLCWNFLDQLRLEC